MPVHYKAGDENARLSYENFLDAGFEPTEGFGLEANIAMFEEMAAKLNSVGCGDRIIQNFLRDELASYFDGGQTAWQCAENLQARLTMYLNE